MANWIEIITGAAAVGGSFSVVTELLKTWLARRNRQDDGREKTTALAIEKQKADDEYDARLIAALMEERKVLHARIQALEDHIEKERAACEEKMREMRREYQAEIADLRTQIGELRKGMGWS